MGYWEGGVDSRSYSWGTGQSRCRLSSSVVNTSDTVSRIDLSGAVRSGNDSGSYYRISGYWVTCYINVEGRSETSTGASWDYANWVANVSDSWYNFARSSSDYDKGIYCRYQGSNGSSNSGKVTGTVTIPKIPYTAPPSPSSISGYCSTTDVIRLSWTNNSSSTGTPASNELQVSIDGGSYASLKSGSLFTTYEYIGEANHKYVFRVKEVNSYGSSGWVEKTIYSTPTAPSVDNLIIYKNKVMFSYKATAAFPSSTVAYQYYATKKGVVIYESDVKTIAANNTITLDTSSDSQLATEVEGVIDGIVDLYVKVASYNNDDSIMSAMAEMNPAEVKLNANVYVRIPNDASMQAIYIRE